MSSRRGVAVMMVLVLVSLVAIYVFAMLAVSSSERDASSVYRDGTRARSLADCAVNLSILQVKEATSSSELLWASQPGAIRNYTDAGKFAAGYKLYSDDEMVVHEDEIKFATEDFAGSAQSWSAESYRWVDINEPAIRGGRAYFPIADPAAKNKMKVEGFDFDKSALSESPMESALAKTGSETLPMPVMWLCQLKDGTLGVLDENKKFVPVSTPDRDAEEPTKTNPIVGRLAFWTDDESCKINLNTASEPTFWDTPRATSRRLAGNRHGEFDDRSYGWSQPVSGEFSRYPGHPAQTALSTVFFPNKKLKPEEMKVIIDAAPKLSWGGSKAATVPYSLVKELEPHPSFLYPSVDDYVFGQNRRLNQISQIAELPVNPAEMVEWAKFFLTVSSRSPELNVFNRPKVSIWPTHSEEETETGNHRTVYDDLIRYCSSFGSAEKRYEYFFQRENADSALVDWFEIQRNREVFEYLKHQLDQPVPGYGGTFSDKWEEDTDQILTEIFDYIRCANLYDENLKPVAYGEKGWKNGKGSQFTDGRRGVSSRASFPGHGQVVPLEIPDYGTRGLGRFYTVSEVGIMFICCGDAGGPDPKDPTKPAHPKGILGSNEPGYGVGKNRMLPRQLSWAANKQERCLQAALLIELFCPSQGWTQLCEDMTIRVEFDNPFRVGGETVEFPAVDLMDWVSTGDAFNGGSKKRGGRIGGVGECAYSSTWGGTVPFWALTKERLVPPLEHFSGDGGVYGNEKNNSEDARRAYPFISVPFVVDGVSDTVRMSGGKFRISLYHGNSHSQIAVDPSEETLVQSFELDFPSTRIPLPTLAQHNGRKVPRHRPNKGPDGYEINRDYEYDSLGRPISSGNGVIFPSFYWSFARSGCGVGDPDFNHGNWGKWSRDQQNTAQERISSQHFGRLYTFSNDWRTLFIQKSGKNYNPRNGADVVRTMVPAHGDYRLLAATKHVSADHFVPHRLYFDEDRYLAHQFTSTATGRLRGYGLDTNAAPLVNLHDGEKDYGYHPDRNPDFPQTEESLGAQKWGDFDNGVSITVDGPYINKPDEGNGRQWQKVNGEYSVPYFDAAGQQELGGAAFFSPNRQISSPVMFGSLPTGVKRGRPWETLLFRPERGHPGEAVPPDGNEKGSFAPPDHVLLDFFWMPVVEPYAISEPLSTAGKVNLNYSMLPFPYIKRATGVAAVMKSEQMLVVPNWAAQHYKKYQVTNPSWNFRFPIDFKETSRQFDSRFKEGGLFRTATEICEIHLVPKRKQNRVKLEGMDDFWEKHALTGDNSRERPYSNIYPRITTKSNTFRVYCRAQVIKKGRDSDPRSFDSKLDTVVAEYRGDCLFERYVDSNHMDIPDYATNPEAKESVLDQYQFRILQDRRFAP